MEVEPVTSEPEVECVKQPLKYTWSFWLFTNNIKNKEKWLENLQKLTDFDTVVDYCIYLHTKLPSQLEHGQDYSVFKKGIGPTWEDVANRAGGRWIIIVNNLDALDRFWHDIVLLMIGASFGDANIAVCGAVVNVRKRRWNKISVWTSDRNETTNMTIGRIIKERLRLGINFILHFYAHNSTSALYSC